MSDVIIGIDLGTTNSLVAFADAAGPRIIASPDGQESLPSVVHIDPATGARTVGAQARRRAVERPMETIYSIKRLMGRSLDEIRPDLRYLTYRVVEHAGGDSQTVDVMGRAAPVHPTAALSDDPGGAQTLGGGALPQTGIAGGDHGAGVFR